MREVDKTTLPTDDSRDAGQRESVPLWSQDEAVAFECAREYLGDIIGIYSNVLSSCEACEVPDEDRVTWLRAEIARLGELKRQISVKDHDLIAEVRSAYGTLWRRLAGT